MRNHGVCRDVTALVCRAQLGYGGPVCPADKSDDAVSAYQEPPTTYLGSSKSVALVTRPFPASSLEGVLISGPLFFRPHRAIVSWAERPTNGGFTAPAKPFIIPVPRGEILAGD